MYAYHFLDSFLRLRLSLLIFILPKACILGICFQWKPAGDNFFLLLFLWWCVFHSLKGSFMISIALVKIDQSLYQTTLMSQWLNIIEVYFSFQCKCSWCGSVSWALQLVVPLFPRASESSVASFAPSWPMREERKHVESYGTFWKPGLKVPTSLLPMFQCLELVIWCFLIQGSKNCSLPMWPGRRWSIHTWYSICQLGRKLWSLICLKIVFFCLLTSIIAIKKSTVSRSYVRNL